MASAGDITVRIVAIDEATPVIRAIHRRVWWMVNGETLMRIVTVALTVAAFVLGRLTGGT